MIFWLILGGLSCVALGAFIGWGVCQYWSGEVFQALFDSGQMLLKTDDGWDGAPDAIAEIQHKQTNAMEVMVPK
jgi:hypothetical protein